ncbi:DUF1120 domain-containing protein [Atlantibacter sp.]|uniref:DUF1120 domain-containing protein n=1 Tax=Atlantibacter sp. TaxID=1903473 RepID=UPI0028A7A3D7|nr:DUF1120 domain-containing protein [Atlantibacter sp.]
MKIHLLSILVLCALTSVANAANSVDLKVTGKLSSGSCVPTLENGGIVDFGHIPLGNLSKTETNQLGHKTQNLTVTCDNPIAVGISITDNRSDSAIEGIVINDTNPAGYDLTITRDGLGLGKTSEGVNIGTYTLSVDVANLKSDGVKVDLLRSDYGEPFENYTTGLFNPADQRILATAAVGQDTPLAAKVTVYPLWIIAAIQGTDTLAITDQASFDGSATIALVYI